MIEDVVSSPIFFVFFFFFFQAEDGIRASVASRGLGNVYRGQCDCGKKLV